MAADGATVPGTGAPADAAPLSGSGLFADPPTASRSARLRRRVRSGDRAVMLAGLAALSYATSFLRERYLVQAALGSSALDQVVAAYALAGLAGNLVAVAVGLVWIDGRRPSRWVTPFGFHLAAAALVAVVWPLGGSVLAFASLISAYELSRQKAAFAGRQSVVLIAAVLAPALSIGVWAAFGAQALLVLVAGYVAGYALQAVVAWWCGRSAHRAPPPATTVHASVLWPLLFSGFMQAQGLLDRLLYPFVGTGWAGAAAFAMNVAGAATLVVVGPLASEAVAGRLPSRPPVRFMVVVVAATAFAVLTVPVWLPVLVQGGMVEGENLDRLVVLTAIYLASVPGWGYWTYRARAVQSSSRQWKPMAVIVGGVFALHLVLALAALAVGAPYGVAVAFLVASYAGAVVLWRRQ